MSIEEEGLSSGNNTADIGLPISAGGNADVDLPLDAGGNMGAAMDMEQMQHEGELAGYFDQYAVGGSFDIGPQEEASLRESIGGLDDEHLQRLSERQFDVYAEAAQRQNDLAESVQIYQGLTKDVPPGAEPPSSDVVAVWQQHLKNDAIMNNERVNRTAHAERIVENVAQERGMPLEGAPHKGDFGRLQIQEEGNLLGQIPDGGDAGRALKKQDELPFIEDPQTDEEKQYNEMVRRFHAIDVASLQESMQNVARQYAEVEADPREFFRRASQRKQPSTPEGRAVQAVEDYAEMKPMFDVQEAHMRASPEEKQRILQQMRDALISAGASRITPISADGAVFFRREGGPLRAIDYAYPPTMDGHERGGGHERMAESDDGTTLHDPDNRPLSDEEKKRYHNYKEKSRILDANASAEERQLGLALERHVHDGGDALEIARKVAKDTGIQEPSWAFGYLQREIQEILYPTRTTKDNIRKLEAHGEVLRGLRKSMDHDVKLGVDAFLQMLDGKASVLQILRNFQEHSGERGRANIDRMKEAMKKKLQSFPLERVQMFLVMLYGVRAAMYIKKFLLGEKGENEGTEDSSTREIDTYIDAAKEVILEKEEERNRKKGRGGPEV